MHAFFMIGILCLCWLDRCQKIAPKNCTKLTGKLC